MNEEHPHETDRENIEDVLRRLRDKTTKRNPLKTIYVVLFCISLSGIVLTLLFYGKESVAEETILPVLPVNPFTLVEMKGSSAIVWDITTDHILFEKEGDTPLPLASVTKLMTAYTAQIHAPSLLEIQIEEPDLLLEGDQGLIPGETWRLDDLLDFSLVTSSNDGMSAVAASIGKLSHAYADHTTRKEVFIQLMNKTAQNKELFSMSFTNESGLDSTDMSTTGGYGSAKDVARLLDLIMTEAPALLERTRDKTISLSSLSGFIHTGENTNISQGKITGLLGSKTGFTDLAGGNLAVVTNIGFNRPVAIVVLGSTLENRFSDVEKLVEATRDYIQVYEPILQERQKLQNEVE